MGPSDWGKVLRTWGREKKRNAMAKGETNLRCGIESASEMKEGSKWRVILGVSRGACYSYQVGREADVFQQSICTVKPRTSARYLENQHR